MFNAMAKEGLVSNRDPLQRGKGDLANIVNPHTMGCGKPLKSLAGLQ